MESVGSSVVSVPSAWRRAKPTQPSTPALIESLEWAAAAHRAGIAPRWPGIGRYQACGKLGQGGMSTVWEALDDQLGRRVAIKLLLPDVSSEHGERLLREAQALAKLSHPNVVQVYEVLEVEGLTSVVMELVEGQTLRRWQEQQPRPEWRACVELYLQAGRGLAAAHAAGLVHRDFKPDNCIVDADGRVRVLDFGLVAREREEPTVDEVDLFSTSDSLELPLTRPGTLLGTTVYMPPERLGLGVSDGAAGDQFSFCISLYEALYGERPFGGSSVGEIKAAIEQGRIRKAPEGTRVPPRLRRIVLRGLASAPGDRWDSMAELLGALERVVAPYRRWPWLGAALLGTTTVGALASAMVIGGPEPTPCTGVEALLDGVWDARQRRAVQEAVVGTGTPHGLETWERLEPMLDAYAQQWTAKHGEVCEATRLTAVQTEVDMGLRMRCLDGRRTALREVVAVLARPDEETRRSAIELVAGLPVLAQCDDLEALHAELPPPRDPELAAAVEDARARLSRARAQREAGSYAEGEREASAVVEVAEWLGYEPLLAEALLERGEARVSLAERDAEHDLARAYDLAQRIEHRYAETRAAIVLARLVANDLSKLGAATVWGRSANNLAGRPGMDPLLEAEAASALGHVRMVKGWLEDAPELTLALELQQDALARYESVLGPSHPAVAEALEAVGDVLMKDKDLAGAQESYERALAIYEASLGPSHPEVADLLSKLGDALVKQQEPQMALELHERELAIQSAVFGPWHPSVARAWTRIGMALHLQGRLEEALALHELALDMTTASLGRDNQAVIGILSEIGFVLRDRGQIAEALAHYDESVAIRDRLQGPWHPSVVIVLKNIGRELSERGMVALAEEYYREALRRNESGRAYPVTRADLTLLLAELAAERGEREQVLEHAERAFEELDELPAGSSSILHRGQFVLARALWGDVKQRGRARQLAEQARAGFRELVRADEGLADELEEVERWLAARGGVEDELREAHDLPSAQQNRRRSLYCTSSWISTCLLHPYAKMKHQ